MTPHRPAGSRIDPPVSLPTESGAIKAATLAAAPPLEPPGMQSSFQGLRVTWKAEFSVDPPMANSSMFVLPIRTASAAFSRAMTVASYGGRNSLSIRDAQVVGSPRVRAGASRPPAVRPGADRLAAGPAAINLFRSGHCRARGPREGKPRHFRRAPRSGERIRDLGGGDLPGI